MVYYITSPAYQAIITSVLHESEQIIAGGDNISEIYLNKYIKEQINSLSGVDIMIIDLSCALDLDTEIISSLETIKVMYGQMRIILLAASMQPGNDLLIKCVQMGIYDIITATDFVEIKDELVKCVLEGKQYRDALRYLKPGEDDKSVGKQVRIKQKQNANRVMIGFAGSQERVGTTHNAIVTANTLRRSGYMVALLEMSSHPVFRDIKESYDEESEDALHFSVNGIDYYPSVQASEVNSIMAKAYNFLVMDFGTFDTMDEITFNKCEVPVIVAGSKPWELDAVNKLFAKTVHENLVRYNFLFNFTDDKYRDDIKSGMAELKKVFFASITVDPFTAVEAGMCEQLCGDYFDKDEQPSKKKRRLFARWKKKRK